jgi:hypothetical protein
LSFALHRIQQTIEPVIPLNTVVERWNELAAELASPNRKRNLQKLASIS